MISFVQFMHPVSIGGEFGSLDYWSREKHGKTIECAEKGNYIVVTLASGQRRRVPITNVAYIADDADAPATPSKK